MATYSQTAPQTAPPPEPFPWRERLGQIVMWLLIALVALYILYPFAWALVTSFKTQRDALQPTFIPFVQFEPTLENWEAELGIGGREALSALGNSALISVGAMVMAILLGTITGYGLALFKFRFGNRNLVSWFLSQRFLPPVATIIPFLLLFQHLRLIDTIGGMIIINTTFVMPFAVLIMRDFFADFPIELKEAALVDGATEWQVFWRVALPLAVPALAAAAVICFAFAWNEYLFASRLTARDARPYTFLIASTGTVRGIHFGFVSTRMLIAVTLPVILSLFVQRYIVRGLTLGAVKG
ncbi:MAG: carbohydrate ABC transporter permease [Chloroflexi bacterium]|nr:carbohydrate ABC transporter permease [Chloroflexota bacterium]